MIDVCNARLAHWLLARLLESKPNEGLDIDRNKNETFSRDLVETSDI